MTKQYVLGLDIGTTSAKAVIFNKKGSVISEYEVGYVLSHPLPGWVEQDPYEIEQAAKLSIISAIQKGAVHAEDIIAVGISAAMHSLICIDQNNEPLSPSITWADRRSVTQAEQLTKANGTNIYLKTGTPLHPMSPLLKLMWMKENQYKPYQKAAKFISIKEFLLLKWFNHAAVDYSIASATGLFNIHTLKWDEDALSLAGVTEEQLFKPVPPTEIFQGLNAQVAEAMGIPINLPFVIGGSDGPLANLGIGAIDEKDVAITIGTSGAIRKMASKPKTLPSQEVFCYAFSDDLWIMGGPTNNGGIIFRWLKEVLGETEIIQAKKQGIDEYDLLTDLAKSVKPGADGLLFFPYLNGERAPHWNANARGSFIGLTQSHKKEHLLRAGLEGVIFNIYQIGETLDQLSKNSQHLLASGGFARSPLWLQILADIFNKEVLVPESHQSSAWGAAWTALYALNEVSSYQAIKESIPMKNKILPDSNNHTTYKELYTIFKSLYQSMEPHLNEIAKVQNKLR